jgi:anthranilate phosphoribosyltransferase
MAEVLGKRGVTAVVVRGDDGMDELSTATTSGVWRWIDGQVVAEQVDPAELGVPRSSPGDLNGGDPEHNAAVARAVLGGEPGPVADAVALNAAAAIAAAMAHRAGGWGDRSFRDSLADALPVAQGALSSGAAAGVLDRWVAISAQVAAA